MSDCGDGQARCYSCGRIIIEAHAYARLNVGGQVFPICCPMCMTASEAGHVQRRMIPKSFSDERVSVFVGYRPALHVGGDYACIRWADTDRLYAIVADISGHGVTSSVIMSRLSGEIENLVRRQRAPAAIGEALNEIIRSLSGDSHTYLTLFSARLDLAAGTLTYVSCGHPDQLLWSATDFAFRRLESTSIPVGLFGSDQFGHPSERQVEIAAGDKLLLYTDGLLDLERDGHPLGDLGLLDEFREIVEHPNPDAGERVFDRLSFLQNRESDDDLLLVCIEMK